MAELKATAGTSSRLLPSSKTGTCLLSSDAASICLIGGTIFQNRQQELNCPSGEFGNTVIVPAGLFDSTISQADADAKAVAFGELSLVCYPNTGAVDFSYVSRTASAILIGFSEFVDPSSPPKKYRKLTGSGSRNRCFYFTSCGVAFSGSDRVDYLGTTSYDAVTGVLTPGAIYNLYQGPACPASVYLTFGALDATPSSSVGDYTSSSLNAKTVAINSGNGCNYGTEAGMTRWCQSYGSLIKTLSDEDTEDDALLRSSYTSGTLSTASRTARGAGEFVFNAVSVFVTAHLSGLVAGFSYRLSYVLNTVIGGNPPVLTTLFLDFVATAGTQDLDVGWIPCSCGETASFSNPNVYRI